MLKKHCVEAGADLDRSVCRVIDIPDVPESLHSQGERGRLQAPGHRTADDSMRTLLIINEADGSWAIHGLGVPGVRLTRGVMVNVAEAILRVAR